jgi:hypothetical protein
MTYYGIDWWLNRSGCVHKFVTPMLQSLASLERSSPFFTLDTLSVICIRFVDIAKCWPVNVLQSTRTIPLAAQPLGIRNLTTHRQCHMRHDNAVLSSSTWCCTWNTSRHCISCVEVIAKHETKRRWLRWDTNRSNVMKLQCDVQVIMNREFGNMRVEAVVADFNIRRCIQKFPDWVDNEINNNNNNNKHSLRSNTKGYASKPQ